MIRRIDFNTTEDDANSPDGKAFKNKVGTNTGSELTARFFNDIYNWLVLMAKKVNITFSGVAENNKQSEMMDVAARMAYQSANLVTTPYMQYPGMLEPNKRPGDYGIWYNIAHTTEYAGKHFRVIGGTSGLIQNQAQNSGAPNIKGEFISLISKIAGNYGFYDDGLNEDIADGCFFPIPLDQFGNGNNSGYLKQLVKNPNKPENKAIQFDASRSSGVYQDGITEVKVEAIGITPHMLVGYSWDTATAQYFQQNAGTLTLAQIYNYLGIKP